MQRQAEDKMMRPVADKSWPPPARERAQAFRSAEAPEKPGPTASSQANPHYDRPPQVVIDGEDEL